MNKFRVLVTGGERPQYRDFEGLREAMDYACSFPGAGRPKLIALPQLRCVTAGKVKDRQAA